MKKILTLLTFLLIFGIAFQVSAATITLSNDGFETGDLTGWTPSGDYSDPAVPSVSVENDPFYQNHGTYYTEITGAAVRETHTVLIGGTPYDVDAYKGFIQQEISWSDDDTYTFDWLFLFDDGDSLDYAYYQIGGVETRFYNKGDTDDPPTGWTPQTILFSGTGTDVVLEIGVVSYNPGSYSRLLVDAAPVPEPASLILLASGLIAIAGARRKI